jgi:hypothetical protein
MVEAASAPSLLAEADRAHTSNTHKYLPRPVLGSGGGLIVTYGKCCKVHCQQYVESGDYNSGERSNHKVSTVMLTAWCP